MAFYLTICSFLNAWFVFTSGKRALNKEHDDAQKNVKYSVFVMALFDVPWVWFCAIQCLHNTFTTMNSFHQSYGDDSAGCEFMGWYSSFSMVSMMGSNCLVGYHLLRYLQQKRIKGVSTSCSEGLVVAALTILVAACFFASIPLIQGDGYLLTTGGFCYTDFTNTLQSSIMLAFCSFFLLLATAIWVNVGLKGYGYFYAIFFCTWILWVPACIYGIKNAHEIPSPYMLIGGIVGHGNALVNPLLYGWHLFQKLSPTEDYSTSNGEDVEQALSKAAGEKEVGVESKA